MTEQTVRVVRADGPRVMDAQSEKESRPSSSAPWITDSPYLVLGRSASNWCRADSPQTPGGQSGPHADSPARTRTVRPARGRSGTPTRTVRQTSCSKTLTPRKIYAWAHKNWMNTRRTCTSRTVRGLWADSPPALEQNSPRWKPRSQHPLSHHGSPKRLELLRKDLGKMWSVPRGCYAPKLGSSNESKCGATIHDSHQQIRAQTPQNRRNKSRTINQRK
jgi:hypothetical protein